MAFRQRLLQKQVQKMIMSMKMQQSMYLLQLPIVELDQVIAEEMAVNPVLEDSSQPSPSDPGQAPTPADEEPSSPAASGELPLKSKSSDEKLEFDWLDNDSIWFSDFFDRNRIAESIEKHNFQETLITKSSSLQDELTQQFRLINDTAADMVIAEQIIGNIAENGYLAASVEEIAATLQCPAADVERLLAQIQSLEPAGVGARDLQECLFIQLKRQGLEHSHEAEIIKNFLPELAARQYNKIGKALALPVQQVKKYAQRISQLDPKPCRNYSTGALRIVPDVILEKNPEGYDIIINTKNLPQLSISQMYKRLLKDKTCPQQTMDFIREKIKNAQNLISGLSQRQQTLEQVTRCVIDYQKEFIEKGVFNLRPLTLKEVAKTLQVHPSTISRTVANKYIQTPYGTFALKKFFSQAVGSDDGTLSNQKVKATLEEIVKTESPQQPLSDQEIVVLLTQKGMPVSRRTVTKYRNALKIPPAHLRKQ